MKKLLGFGIWFLGFSFLIACTSPSPITTRQPLIATFGQPPTASAQPPTPTPSDTGWVSLDPGLDRREIVVPFSGLGFAERLILFRVDPSTFTFRVRYSPGFPRYVSEWDAAAQLVFNAGFFDEKNAALGL